ncbi:MAG: hypothetical protein Q9184_001422 [Pyrenodesmia sp. 2 TL-2023]
MAAVPAVSAPASMLDSQWNEAQIESALARLQEMHAQLRLLRDAVPRLIDPMLVQQPSPEDLYSTFATNVTTIKSDVKDFSITFQNSESQEILQKAEKSRAESKEDIPSWRVTEHEGWLDVRGVDTSMDIAMGGMNGADPDADQEASIDLDYLRAATERSQKANPSVDFSLDEKSNMIKVECKPSPRQGSVYTVTTSEKTNTHAAIVKAINARTKPKNLEHLLEMLASYTDIRSRRCSKCQRLLDPNAQFPIVRSKKKTKQSDGHYRLAWEAYHTSCN